VSFAQNRKNENQLSGQSENRVGGKTKQITHPLTPASGGDCFANSPAGREELNRKDTLLKGVCQGLKKL